MIVQTIHEPPEPPADRLEQAAALAFIKDGFSLVAALLAPLWMLASGVWLGTLVYVAGLALLATLFSVAGWDARWLLALVVALHIAIGFEASSLRRWALERRGWRMLGTVAGGNAEECERRFFDAWLPAKPMSRQEEFIATVNALRQDGAVPAAVAATADAMMRDRPGAPRPRGGWWAPWSRS